MYGRILKRAFKRNDVVQLLVDATGGGPCDGGCLIVAKAVIHAMGRGSLVRLVSGAISQHYGALVDGIIYDAHGSHSPRTWARKFAKLEHTDVFEYREGYVDETDSGIPDDPRAVQELTPILFRALEGARL